MKTKPWEARWSMAGCWNVYLGDEIPTFALTKDRELDAKLIAAAPELLEALQRLVEPCPPDFVVEWAKDIIAKTRGGVPCS